MSLNKIKTTITEFDGIRCAIVETGASGERAAFLKELLEHNKFEVKILDEKKENEQKTYIVAVTDTLFNTVFAVYERTLKSIDGYKVTPAYWKQHTPVFDPRYWLEKEKVKK